jgi:adenylate cyclase
LKARVVEEQVYPSAWLERKEAERVPLRGPCFIGRNPTSTIVLASEKVSRKHAMVQMQKDSFWIVDLGSANGTYVNGRRLTQPARLADRDQIRIGDFAFEFRLHNSQNNAPETIVENPTIQDIKHKKCWLLVADIESSTQLIKKVPAEEAPLITGRWLVECKQMVEDCGGSINKFLGDGFFAYWVEDDIGRAAEVARLLNAFKNFQEKSPLRFRVVLHYGQVFMGGGPSREESLMGAEVNFVFRMEKVAGSAGCSRMVSEAVHDRMKENITFSEEGKHSVPSFEGEFLFFTY